MNLDRATFRQIRDLLVPLVGSESEQRAFVDAAFFDTPISGKVRFGDPADIFAVQLIRICYNHGMLDQDEHAISALLDSIQSRVGIDAQEQIEGVRGSKILAPLLNGPEISTLIQQYMDEADSQNWDKAAELLEQIQKRDTVPSWFDIEKEKHTVDEKIAEIRYLESRESKYSLIQAIAETNTPDLVYKALEDFLEEYPDYEPDLEIQKIAYIGFQHTREAAYQQIRESVKLDSPENVTIALREFWIQYPKYDPDNIERSIEYSQLLQATINLSPEETLAHFAHFARRYPGYDPKGIKSKILHTIRSAEYQKIRDLKFGDIQTLENSLNDFSNNYPNYDPDDLRGFVKAIHKINQSHTKTTVDLSGLGLRDFPEDVWQLHHIEHLSLRKNPIRSVPYQIKSFKMLKTLDLSNMKLIEIPSEIGELTELEILTLSNNELVVIPESIFHIAVLRHLYLRSNKLILLPSISENNTNLIHLDLNNNQLTDCPAEIEKFTNLETLLLGRNQLVDLPNSITQLTYLQTLDLSNNNLTHIPERIGRLTNLRTLLLNGNQLTELPDSIGHLTSLQTLALGHNQLRTLPDSIAELSNIQTLDLSSNQLVKVPHCIPQLISLTDLNIMNNGLVDLPPALGQMQSLEALYVRGGNDLSKLPDDINQKSNATILASLKAKVEAQPPNLFLRWWRRSQK